MTCIVGIAYDGEVYIGSDSLGGSKSQKNTYKRPKVFINGDFIIGYTTSFRMGQILEFEWIPPKRTPGVLKISDYQFMVKSVVPSIKKCFKEHGFGSIKEGEQDIAGDFLIGYNGSIYHLHEDFSVLESTDDFNSVGSGFHIALGSLASTTDWKRPEERITKAIQVAEKYKPTVQGPIHIKVLNKNV